MSYRINMSSKNNSLLWNSHPTTPIRLATSTDISSNATSHQNRRQTWKSASLLARVWLKLHACCPILHNLPNTHKDVNALKEIQHIKHTHSINHVLLSFLACSHSSILAISYLFHLKLQGRLRNVDRRFAFAVFHGGVGPARQQQIGDGRVVEDCGQVQHGHSLPVLVLSHAVAGCR